MAAADLSTGVNARIAARVRGLRAQLSLSLEALAERSGVSRSMLSLIERGESSPTAVVMERIATALGVSLATLFDNPTATGAPVSRGAQRTAWQDPQTGYVRCNISPPDFPSPIQIVDVMLPGGSCVAYEAGGREPGIPHQIWVRQGRIEVSLGEVTHSLEQDDCLAMQLTMPVTYRNRTRRDARYVVVRVQTGRAMIPEWSTRTLPSQQSQSR